MDRIISLSPKKNTGTAPQESAPTIQVVIIKLTACLKRRQTEHRRTETTPNSQRTIDNADYEKHIGVLEAKRANLIGQKVALERKLDDFRETRRRRAEDDAEKKELGFKR